MNNNRKNIITIFITILGRLALVGIVVFIFCPLCYSATIYADNQAGGDCSGNYSIANRNCTGSDGNSYDNIEQAVRAMSTGDDLIVRSGTTYTLHGGATSEYGYGLQPPSGTANDYTTISGYTPDGSRPIINANYRPPVNASIEDGVINLINHHYVKLEYLDLRNGSKGNVFIGYHSACSNITINDCHIIDWCDEGGASENSGGIWVHNDFDNLTITNNLFDGNGTGDTRYGGIIIFGPQSDMTGSGVMNISNNIFKDAGLGIYWKHPNEKGGASTIENNFIIADNCTSCSGIRLCTGDMTVNNNIIISTSDGPYGAIKFGCAEGGQTSTYSGFNNTFTHNTIYGGAIWHQNGQGEDNHFQDNLVYNHRNYDFRTFGIKPYSTCPETGDYFGTTADYNCYYNTSRTSNPFRICNTYPSLTQWRDYLDGSANSSCSGSNNECNSIIENPAFANGSGNMNQIADFEITGGNANNGASDGTDMGADITKVGIKSNNLPINFNNPPNITITNPTTEPLHNHPNNNPIDISGTASDNGSITSVTWSNNRCPAPPHPCSGVADGTTNWSVSEIYLTCGDHNIITVTAQDNEGNTRTDNLTIDVPPCIVEGLDLDQM